MLVSQARKNIPQQVKVAFGGYNTRFNMKYDSPAEEQKALENFQESYNDIKRINTASMIKAGYEYDEETDTFTGKYFGHVWRYTEDDDSQSNEDQAGTRRVLPWEGDKEVN